MEALQGSGRRPVVAGDENTGERRGRGESATSEVLWPTQVEGPKRAGCPDPPPRGRWRPVTGLGVTRSRPCWVNRRWVRMRVLRNHGIEGVAEGREAPKGKRWPERYRDLEEEGAVKRSGTAPGGLWDLTVGGPSQPGQVRSQVQCGQRARVQVQVSP